MLTVELIAVVSNFWASSPAKLWCGLFLTGIAVETLTRSQNDWRSVLLNMRYSTIYLLVIFTVSPLTNTVVSRGIATLGGGWIDIDIFSHTDLPGQVGAAIILLIAIDFFYYWWHRAQHANSWLWDQHAVHHSDESLNISSSIRHHWSEFIFQALLITLPLGVLFKMTPINMWVVSTVVAGWSWFIHLNVRLPFGLLSWLIVGPQAHRIHHSRMPLHRDRNFAAYFSVWDVIFGTFHAATRGEYPPVGVPGLQIQSARQAAIYPLARWYLRLMYRLRTHSGR